MVRTQVSLTDEQMGRLRAEARRRGMPIAAIVREAIDRAVVAVLPVEPALHVAAQTAYRASLPSGTSFVDQVSFGVMAREAIDTAFALDDDFAAAAVTIIPTS